MHKNTRMTFGVLTAFLSINSLASYPKALVENRTTFPAKVHVTYAACKSDTFNVPAGTIQTDALLPGTGQAHTNRGACLIRSVSATLSGATHSVTTYTSPGTSFSHFIIQAGNDNYRIWSRQELAAETSSREGKSPGFYIVNKTMWPVSIALEQVGCLYYDTIKPGEAFNRNTGAVWFTIQASISPDGKEIRTNWDCVKPVAEVLGTVILTAATAGGAAYIAGAEVASQVVWAAGKSLTKEMVKKVGEALQPNSAGTLKGQYAGPDWPLRCDRKPTYEITGGFGELRKTQDGSNAVDTGSPLKITKTNTCGNSMMR